MKSLLLTIMCLVACCAFGGIAHAADFTGHYEYHQQGCTGDLNVEQQNDQLILQISTVCGDQGDQCQLSYIADIWQGDIAFFVDERYILATVFTDNDATVTVLRGMSNKYCGVQGTMQGWFVKKGAKPKFTHTE